MRRLVNFITNFDDARVLVSIHCLLYVVRQYAVWCQIITNSDFRRNNFVDLLHVHAIHIVYYECGGLSTLSSISRCRLVELVAVSKVMPTLKVSLQRGFLADLTA